MGRRMQTGRRGEQAFPESERTKPYGKQERKNKTEWTNRKRTGNLLIKADRTGDSVLVRIYTSPAQTRACRWRPVAPAPVRTVTGTWLRSPPPNYTGSSSIPRAVCDWYKPDRRQSGRGPGPPPALSPPAERGVSPSVPCARREAAASRRRPWPPPGPVQAELTACWGQKKQSQEEDEPLACHAALPGPPPVRRRFHQGQV